MWSASAEVRAVMPTRASDGVAVKALTDTNVPATTSAASVFSIAYDLKKCAYMVWFRKMCLIKNKKIDNKEPFIGFCAQDLA